MVLGASGSGKSSLIRALFGLAPGDAEWRGEPRTFDGAAWPAPGTTEHAALLQGPVCVLPQDARAAFDPLVPLGAQIAAVCGARAPRRHDLCAAYAELGLDVDPDWFDRPPHAVSGGQVRAAVLTIALLRRARLLVADEPTVGLDAARTARLVRQLGLFRERGASLLVATHDPQLVDALTAQLDAVCWSIDAGELQRGRLDRADWPVRSAAAEGAVGDAEWVVRAEKVGFDRGRDRVLRDVDLEIRAGSSTAVLGPPGAGKSTLGRLLSGELTPTAGRIERGPGSQPRAAVQLLRQDAGASLTPGRSIRSMLRETAEPGFDIDAEAAALGLGADVLSRDARSLSGGERRRAALLRALSVRPRLLILDEPTADLDRASALDVVALVRAAADRHRLATVWITHDRGLADAVAPGAAVELHAAGD